MCKQKKHESKKNSSRQCENLKLFIELSLTGVDVNGNGRACNNNKSRAQRVHEKSLEKPLITRDDDEDVADDETQNTKYQI